MRPALFKRQIKALEHPSIPASSRSLISSFPLAARTSVS